MLAGQLHALLRAPQRLVEVAHLQVHVGHELVQAGQPVPEARFLEGTERHCKLVLCRRKLPLQRRTPPKVHVRRPDAGAVPNLRRQRQRPPIKMARFSVAPLLHQHVSGPVIRPH